MTRAAAPSWRYARPSFQIGVDARLLPAYTLVT